MADCAAAARVLCSPETEVSAHYLISPQGEVAQLVDESERAWHAGAGRWGEVTDVNNRSIGIELSNTGFAPFSALLMTSLERLLHEIMSRWSIPPERVIGHSDCAPGRKIDPGVRFDWCRLAKSGLSIWPHAHEPAVADDLVEATDTALVAFGYNPEIAFETKLAAFRLRFRPRHEGPVDGVDLAIAKDLVTRFSVDRQATSA